MRVYLVDEFRGEDIEKIKSALVRKKLQAPIEDIFHLPLPQDFFDEEQQNHADTCAPYYLSLETGSTWIRLELLVRSASTLRCSCVKYANDSQREHCINTLDNLLQNLDISV